MDALQATTIVLEVVRKRAIEGVNGEACELTIRGLERARNGVNLLAVALREVAERFPAGDPTRILAVQALQQAGFTIDNLPPSGRQVTFKEAS